MMVITTRSRSVLVRQATPAAGASLATASSSFHASADASDVAVDVDVASAIPESKKENVAPTTEKTKESANEGMLTIRKKKNTSRMTIAPKNWR